MKKAGKALSAEDKAAIIDAARGHREAGKSASDAAKLAVSERIEHVNALLVEAGKPKPVVAEPVAEVEQQVAETPIAQGVEPENQESRETEKLAASSSAETIPEKSQSTSEPKAAAKIEDVGEKIGGARKDKWKESGLSVSDLDAMSESEGATHAKKANVWKPDYSKMVADGAEPQAAALVKVIYDSLAAQPKDDTPAGRRRYVNTMQAVREVYGDVKTEADVKTARATLLYDHLNWTMGGAGSNEKAAKNSIGVPDLRAHHEESRRKLFAVYKGRSDPFVVTYAERSRAEKLVDAGFPDAVAPWTRRYDIREMSGGKFRISTKSGQLLGYADTRADAEAKAVAAYEEAKAKSTNAKTEPQRPHLDSILRKGMAQSVDRDVTPEELQKDFGFRGIEFGNWTAQDERQRIMNMAYDALSDLATVLNVPQKAIGLNGTMGMAFGARGGGKFAAHYEPGKLVINITKLRGAGALAHEWAHAFDHYLGEYKRDDAYTGKARGASGWYDEQSYDGIPKKRFVQKSRGEWETIEQSRLPNLRPELATKIDTVMQSLFKAMETKADMVRESEASLEKAKAQAAALSGNPDAQAVYQRRVDAQTQALEELRKEPENKLFPMGRSKYAANAQALSGKSTTGYWIRPTEMFARAFESYVFDRIADMGARSDFLVHSVEGDRYAGPEYKGNPYPTGSERSAINTAFDGLVSEIQTKETEDGNVAMFNKASGTATPFDKLLHAGIAEGRTTTETLKAIQKASKNAFYRELAGVLLKAGVNPALELGNPKGLKFSVKNRAAESFAAAFFPKANKVALFTDVNAERNLLHEIMHAATFQAIRKPSMASGQLRALFSHVKRSGQLKGMYGMENMDEFIAEAFSNPKFQAALKGVSAATLRGGKIGHAFDWFVNIVRSILGLPKGTESALSQVIDIGTALIDQQRNMTFAQRASDRVAAMANDKTAVGNTTGNPADGDLKGTVLADLFTQEEREQIAQYDRDGDRFGAMEESRLAAVNALERYLPTQGYPIEHASESRNGAAKTIYVRVHDELVRVSDHDLPLTPEREHNRGLGLNGKWSREVLVDPNATLDEAVNQILGIDPEDTRTPEQRAADRAEQKAQNEIFAAARAKKRAAEFAESEAKRQTEWEEQQRQLTMDSEKRRLELYEARDPERAQKREQAIALIESGQPLTGQNKRLVQWFNHEVKNNRLRPNEPTTSQNGDVMGNVADDPGIQDRIRQRANDLLSTQKTFNWWNNTIGTQYAKAEKDADFKRVFDSTQRYIGDVSRLANAAADMAKTLLPKTEGLKDIVNFKGKDWREKLNLDVSNADRAAIAKPIYQGTLTDQKVYSGAELRSQFALTDAQIGLYREHRAAINQSLDDLFKTDVLRYVGKDAKAVRDTVMQSANPSAAAAIIADHLTKLGKTEDIEAVNAKTARVEQLKSEGYAPLMRFGRYAVYVTDPNGETISFTLHENERDATKQARLMQETNPGATVQQSVMSEDAHKLYAGMEPETLELFAEMSGAEATPAFQQYLKMTKSNRDAMKRLVKRKGIAGFDQDPVRSLAAFITSNARAGSKNLNFGDMLQAAGDIPREKGDVVDQAVKLIKYVQDPQQEAQAIRGLLFVNYIGGSAASALVNLTQPLTMTFPYLSQFGTALAAKEMTAAMRTAIGKKIMNPELAAALKRAEADGIVSPQEIHQLEAEASGRFGKNQYVRKGMYLWGSMFALAEQYNRRVTFIAAYNVAKANGEADPFAFAEKAVQETQGVYNKGNRPNWARGAMGSTIFTFKQFSISYLEFLGRLPNKEKAIALGILLLTAGIQGLPGADDLDDIIDTLGQQLGYDTNAKAWKTRALTEAIGRDGAEFVMRGGSAIPGFPLDVAGRMGMGNLIPGTGALLKSKADKKDEILEVAGAAGSFAKDLLSGKFAPLAVRNLQKAVDMYSTGMYRDEKGRKVIDADGYDAIIKGIGFQPASVALDSRQAGMVQQSIALAKQVKSDIAQKWAEGIMENDPSKITDAAAKLHDWNQKNPNSPIGVTAQQITQRVNEMMMDRDDRVLKRAPREMRAAMADLYQ
jgi:hypothetical protein